MKPIRNVDEYIALAPKEMQGKLKELRATIKAAAPRAQERISYGMPYYEYKGRLVYFTGHWQIPARSGLNLAERRRVKARSQPQCHRQGMDETIRQWLGWAEHRHEFVGRVAGAG